MEQAPTHQVELLATKDSKGQVKGETRQGTFVSLLRCFRCIFVLIVIGIYRGPRGCEESFASIDEVEQLGDSGRAAFPFEGADGRGTRTATVPQCQASSYPETGQTQTSESEQGQEMGNLSIRSCQALACRAGQIRKGYERSGGGHSSGSHRSREDREGTSFRRRRGGRHRQYADGHTGSGTSQATAGGPNESISAAGTDGQNASPACSLCTDDPSADTFARRFSCKGIPSAGQATKDGGGEGERAACQAEAHGRCGKGEAESDRSGEKPEKGLTRAHGFSGLNGISERRKLGFCLANPFLSLDSITECLCLGNEISLFHCCEHRNDFTHHGDLQRQFPTMPGSSYSISSLSFSTDPYGACSDTGSQPFELRNTSSPIGLSVDFVLHHERDPFLLAHGKCWNQEPSKAECTDSKFFSVHNETPFWCPNYREPWNNQWASRFSTTCTQDVIHMNEKMNEETWQADHAQSDNDTELQAPWGWILLCIIVLNLTKVVLLCMVCILWYLVFFVYLNTKQTLYICRACRCGKRRVSSPWKPKGDRVANRGLLFVGLLLSAHVVEAHAHLHSGICLYEWTHDFPEVFQQHSFSPYGYADMDENSHKPRQEGLSRTQDYTHLSTDEILTSSPTKEYREVSLHETQSSCASDGCNDYYDVNSLMTTEAQLRQRSRSRDDQMVPSIHSAEIETSQQSNPGFGAGISDSDLIPLAFHLLASEPFFAFGPPSRSPGAYRIIAANRLGLQQMTSEWDQLQIHQVRPIPIDLPIDSDAFIVEQFGDRTSAESLVLVDLNLLPMSHIICEQEEPSRLNLREVWPLPQALWRFEFLAALKITQMCEETGSDKCIVNIGQRPWTSQDPHKYSILDGMYLSVTLPVLPGSMPLVTKLDYYRRGIPSDRHEQTYRLELQAIRERLDQPDFSPRSGTTATADEHGSHLLVSDGSDMSGLITTSWRISKDHGKPHYEDKGLFVDNGRKWPFLKACKVEKLAPMESEVTFFMQRPQASTPTLGCQLHNDPRLHWDQRELRNIFGPFRIQAQIWMVPNLAGVFSQTVSYEILDLTICMRCALENRPDLPIWTNARGPYWVRPQPDHPGIIGAQQFLLLQAYTSPNNVALLIHHVYNDQTTRGTILLPHTLLQVAMADLFDSVHPGHRCRDRAWCRVRTLFGLLWWPDRVPVENIAFLQLEEIDPPIPESTNNSEQTTREAVSSATNCTTSQTEWTSEVTEGDTTSLLSGNWHSIDMHLTDFDQASFMTTNRPRSRSPADVTGTNAPHRIHIFTLDDPPEVFVIDPSFLLRQHRSIVGDLMEIPRHSSHWQEFLLFRILPYPPGFDQWSNDMYIFAWPKQLQRGVVFVLCDKIFEISRGLDGRHERQLVREVHQVRQFASREQFLTDIKLIDICQVSGTDYCHVQIDERPWHLWEVPGTRYIHDGTFLVIEIFLMYRHIPIAEQIRMVRQGATAVQMQEAWNPDYATGTDEDHQTTFSALSSTGASTTWEPNRFEYDGHGDTH